MKWPQVTESKRVKQIFTGIVTILILVAFLVYLATPDHKEEQAAILIPLEEPVVETRKEILEVSEPPIQRFGRPTILPSMGPRVNIVVDEIDLDPEQFQSIFASVPKDVTLVLESESPLIPLAREMGFELLMQVPMEPSDFPYNDPGRNALFTFLPKAENEKRLDSFFQNDPPFVGMTPFMGEAYLKDHDLLEQLIAWLGRRGYGFLDPSNQTDERNKLMHELASSYGTFAYINPYWIDALSSSKEMNHQLSLLEHEGKKAGVSLGIIHAYPESIETLKTWSTTLPDKGIYLVPFSSIFIEPGVEEPVTSTEDLPDLQQPSST